MDLRKHQTLVKVVVWVGVIAMVLLLFVPVISAL